LPGQASGGRCDCSAPAIGPEGYDRGAADGQSREAEPDEPAPEAAAPTVEGSEAAPRRPQAGEPVDFGQFLLSLGAQAGLLLSREAGAEEREGALEGARSIISILEMLKDKTEGRRTDEEERVLDGLLYELRMAYVAAAREGGT
jgi:hypothetical protein